MSKDKHDQVGNVASAAIVEREMLKLANALYVFDGRFSRESLDDIALRGLKFVAPPRSDGEWLAVVTAWQGSEAVVAFHRDSSFVQCVQGVCNRLNNGSLRWKEDQPYVE